jgi:hypothetical protein
MMLLKLAGICLPAKVLAVDESDSKISLIRWHMLKVSVESSSRLSVSIKDC